MVNSTKVKLTVLPADLRLWDDQLARVAVISASDWMVEDTDGLEDMSNNLDLSREVRWVTKDLLGLGAESHTLTLLTSLLHGGLDADSLGTIVGNFIQAGVQHIGSTIDGRETSEALWELAETVKWVDVWRFSVAGDGVTVEADTLDGLGCSAFLGDIVVGCVEGHGVANEVAGGCLKAELVEDILHGAGLDVETCAWSVYSSPRSLKLAYPCGLWSHPR